MKPNTTHLSEPEEGITHSHLPHELYACDRTVSENEFAGIIGGSSALRQVLEKVRTVASTPSTVLIEGETGTGKDLIARALHAHSPRRSRQLVTLNCAAIPSTLLESELFGYERGAFTGALQRKIGRFEMADKGTLFLDEVGDIPLELQAKLLRVLQDQEFERLGGLQSIHADIRLVAATNRDLCKMVGDGLFRADLYYRLNVFPIQMPPLRQRKEDIPLLVESFAATYSRQMNKKIETISPKAMAALQSYHWPGNIRELQNFIERAVILTRHAVLEPPLEDLKHFPGSAPQGSSSVPIAVPLTLNDAERDYILQVLDETHWRVGGPGGAAVRLGLKRTTLLGRMKKLGVTRTAGPRSTSRSSPSDTTQSAVRNNRPSCPPFRFLEKGEGPARRLAVI